MKTFYFQGFQIISHHYFLEKRIYVLKPNQRYKTWKFCWKRPMRSGPRGLKDWPYCSAAFTLDLGWTLSLVGAET